MKDTDEIEHGNEASPQSIRKRGSLSKWIENQARNQVSEQRWKEVFSAKLNEYTFSLVIITGAQMDSQL